MKSKVILSWSGGKDSALALHELRKNGDYEVAALLTTITRDYDRVCMHGVRTALLEQQAKSLDLVLENLSLKKYSSQRTLPTTNMKPGCERSWKNIKPTGFALWFLEMSSWKS
ncbi:MAG: Dph6-related ATP pyrophosphatase [Planctomycetota bacterium]